MKFRALLTALVLCLAAAAAHAQCTVQLSDEGIIRMASGERRELTWNAVPGASSYLVETLIEGLNEPSGTDFMFGAPYTESRNIEARQLTSIDVEHAVLWKIRFRYIVTALNRENPAWVPCKDDVLYVVEPDAQLAQIAESRYVPLAGKTPGANGANFRTSLVLMATGRHGNPDDPNTAKIYQGRIWFRPVGTIASANDPSIPYAIDGDETLVIDDVMAELGATGIGTLEIRPRTGFPTPQVDAIIENRMTNGQALGVRVPAAWGRNLLDTRQSIAAGIPSTSDARLSVGVRSLAGPGMLTFQHLAADGTVIEYAQQFTQGDMTTLYPLQDLFATPMEKGHRVTASFHGFDLMGAGGSRFPGAKGVVLFLTETGNHFNNPNVIYRESLSSTPYDDGFDRFIVR